MRRFKSLYARYNRSRDLINVGAYVSGSDPELDRAIDIFPRLEEFLRQDMGECDMYRDSVARLEQALATA